MGVFVLSSLCYFSCTAGSTCVKVQSHNYKNDKPALSYSKIKKKLQKKSYHTDKVKLDKLPYQKISNKTQPPVFRSHNIVQPSKTFNYHNEKNKVDTLFKKLPVNSL